VKVSLAEIRKVLGEIPDKNENRKRLFTEFEDRLMLLGWETKTKEGLAKKIGCSVGTLRTRYRELTEKG